MNLIHANKLGEPNRIVKYGEQLLFNNVRMSLQARINELFTENPEKRPADLARFAKISRASISDWMSGDTQTIKATNAFKVGSFFGVNAEWIADGKGPKYSGNKSPLVEPTYSTHLQALRGAELSNVEPGPDIRGKVPLISWVMAGEWCGVVDNFQPGDAEEWLPCPVSHGPHTYALRVKGDSMTAPYPGQRSYPEGVLVFVDPDRAMTNGCRVIAKLPHSDEVTFKEYREDGGKRYLKPLNPQYQMQEIGDDTRLCGVVIGLFLAE